MKSTKAAVRYARALFQQALETGKTEQVNMDVRFIKGSLGDRNLRVFLSSPVIRKEKKRSIMKELYSGAVSDLSLSFILLLTDKRREMIIPEICNAFMDLYYAHKGIIKVTMTTAVKADDEMKARILKLVSTISKGEVELEEIVDERILGGFILRIGDNQVNASVAGKLQQIKNNLSKNVYSAALS